MRRLMPAVVVLAVLGLAALEVMASREAPAPLATHRLLFK
jgi:hypothetical protein